MCLITRNVMFHTVIVGKHFDDLHILNISMDYEELRIHIIFEATIV